MAGSTALKALACRESPFEISVWLDSDCKVKVDLEPLFSSIKPPWEVALCFEKNLEWEVKQGFLKQGEKFYNSGVLAFVKDSEIIAMWAKEAPIADGLFYGDQNLLSHILTREQIPFLELDRKWNWQPMRLGKNPDSYIDHYLAGDGSSYIVREILRSQFD